MRTRIYIDGLNLYYGCFKDDKYGRPYKWLDLKKLFQLTLGPKYQIIGINYFTARVKAAEHNPSVVQRQQTYIDALEAYIPEIKTHYGYFLRKKVGMENANPPPPTCRVFKNEEKGSDVNLSVHLLNDAWMHSYDCAVIASNDSDMAEAMKLVKNHFPHKKLGLVTPGEKRRTSDQLIEHADFVRKIQRRTLKKSQLPNLIPGTNIQRPDTW